MTKSRDTHLEEAIEVAIGDLPVISLDWKAIGQDFLFAAREVHSDCKFLFSDEFESEIEDLVHHSMEAILGDLANVIRRHGKHLVLLNTQNDDYHFILVSSLADLAQPKFEDIRNLGYQLVESQSKRSSDQNSKKTKPSNSKTKSKDTSEKQSQKRTRAVSWFEDALDFGVYFNSSGVNQGCIFDYMVDVDSNTEELFLYKIDLSAWPPIETKLEDSNHDKSYYLGLHDCGHSNELGFLFKRSVLLPHAVNGHSEEYEFLVLNPNTKTLTELGAKENRSKTWGTVPVLRKSWFTCEPFGTVGTVGTEKAAGHDQDSNEFEFVRWTSAGPKVLSSFLGANKRRLLKLDSDRILILSLVGDKCRYQVWDEGKQGFLFDNSRSFPYPVLKNNLEAVFALDRDRIFFFFETRRPNPNGSSADDQFLEACNLDLTSGRVQICSLEAVITIAKLPRASDRKLVDTRLVDSGLNIQKGHDDWWIINHQRRIQGTGPHFWFWNLKTGEYFVIDNRQLKSEGISLSYSPELKSYIGFSGTEIKKMIPFHDIQSHSKINHAAWTKVSP